MRFGSRQRVADWVAQLARFGQDSGTRTLGPGHLDRQPGLANIEIRYVMLRPARPRDRPGDYALVHCVLPIGSIDFASTREDLKLAFSSARVVANEKLVLPSRWLRN